MTTEPRDPPSAIWSSRLVMLAQPARVNAATRVSKQKGSISCYYAQYVPSLHFSADSDVHKWNEVTSLMS